MNMGGKLLNPDYRDMVECLLREGVDFMLVGGYAVALHGWPRTTFDIDFWIMANPENAKAVMQAIKAFGAPLQGLTEDDFHRPGMVFQIGVEPQRIDIISAVDGLDYTDASSRAVKMNVDGLEIKVLSLDDLIINKRSSGRPKDVADALALEKLREKKMDRTVVKMTILEMQDEAFCLSLTIDERLKVLEELNRIGRVAAGYPESRLDRTIVHAA